MKAVVVGFGAIGSRHARLLEQLGHDVAVVSRRTVDWRVQFSDLRLGIEKSCPDYVVIASRTSEHLSDYEKLCDIQFDGLVLMEKPVFQHVPASIPSMPADVFVAFNLRFHPLIREMKALLAGKKILALHAYVGQYLPDWRPHQDYRQSYSAQKKLGGGVLRDLSHELDYIQLFGGKWNAVSALGGKFSQLETDSEDIFSLLMRTDECPAVSVHLNYLHHGYRRDVVAITDSGTFSVNFADGILNANGDQQSFAVDRDETFLGMHTAILSGQHSELCTFDEALGVSALINAAETAAANLEWVHK
jgi:predicted dehydrogenase